MAERLPLTLFAYQGITKAATPLVGAIIKRRLKAHKEDPQRFQERRGRSNIRRPQGPLVWIHGASVGEVLAAAALVERLRAMGMRILLTSGTVTSAAIAAKRFPPDVIHQYVPFDAPSFVDAFLDHWQPNLALFIESDLWPNLIIHAAARRVPLVLINGRMSQRSFPRWSKLSKTIGAVLQRFDLCLTQSATDAERYTALGGRNVSVTGNLKLDVPAPPADPAKLERLVSLTRGRSVILASSTHPGEEEMLQSAHSKLAKFFPGLLFIIVPRHPHRGEGIARMIAAAGTQVALRSAGELPTPVTDVYVADTMGELGLFYRLAPIVFMGGSLVPHGGQNPIEPIKLGGAIVHGPHVFNFTEIYDALDRADGAKQVCNGGRAGQDLRSSVVASDRAAGDAQRGGSCRRRTRRRVGPHASCAAALSVAAQPRNGRAPCVSPRFGIAETPGYRSGSLRSQPCMAASPDVA